MDIPNFLKLINEDKIIYNDIKKYKRLKNEDIPDDIGKYKLNVVFKLNERDSNQLSYYELYHYLRYFYRTSEYFKKGLIAYEYFNAKNNKIKPRIDIDKKVTEVFDEDKGKKITVEKNMEDPSILEKYVEEVLNNIYVILKSLFPQLEKEDFAISRDSRWVEKKEETYFKISYHVVLWNKKVDSNIFKDYLIQNKEVFEEFGLWDAIDTKIYMSGFTKWRLPFCKKISMDQNEDNSLLKPINYIEYQDFHKHIVTYIIDCDELDIQISKTNEKNDYQQIEYNSYQKDFLLKLEDNNKEIQDIKSKYKIIGAPRLDEHLEYIDIEEHICGINHNNNHNFLVHDTLKGTLKIKCHSQKCVNFSKLLYKPKNNYNEFDVDYFNNIPLLEGQNNNYDNCKDYFENFFKFMRDSNAFYRIDNTYDRRLKYYERKVKPVKIEGYTDLMYQEKNDEGEIKPKKFIEKYKNDNYKNAYFDLAFEPYNKKLDNEPDDDKNFNLFNGYNYENILTFEEKKNIPEEKYKKLDKLLNHIKKYQCSDIEKHFDFLMQYFANIIQRPQFIPQIILIFYSSTHGCHAYNTPILMYNGDIKMVQDIKEGDLLMGDDSTPRKVNYLARGKQKMCRIIPNKGETFDVNLHHYLCLKYCPETNQNKLFIKYYDENLKKITKYFKNINEFKKFKKECEKKVYEVRVDKYLELPKYIQKRFFIYRNEVKFENKEVFDPYLLGLWLGDGHSSNTQITNQDSEIIKYLKKNLGQYNLYLQHQKSKEYGYRINSIKYNKYGNKLLDILKNYNLLNNKHIPKDYKCNSRENQLKLLAGLIDTDGHYDKKGKCYEIVQKKENIIDDIIFISRSLGFSAYKKIKVINNVNYYRTFISGNNINEIPVLIKRKKVLEKRKINKNNLNIGFKVELLSEDNYYGFNLDGNHRFVQGDFIIQRNTGKSNLTRFLSEVIGNSLSFFGSLKQITETHTNAHLGKLLNVIEEVDNFSTRQYENIIKDYSQRSYAALNQKNKDIIQIKTFVRYIFTTNHYNGVYFDNEDRRYVVYTFQKIHDKKYIDEMQDIMNDNYVKYLFGLYLENYQVKYKNPNDWYLNRFKSEDYYNMMSEDPLKNFLKQIYSGDYINIEEEDPNSIKIDEENKECILIHYNKFTDLLKDFCIDNGEKKPKIMNVNKQLTSTYKEIIINCHIKRRKFYKIDLFKLGEFLNQQKIQNNYNNYKQEIIEEIKD